jgi:hypothetical protein
MFVEIHNIHHENRACETCDFLPVHQVQASQFQLHISYFLQNCKKSKSGEMDLPLQKNDITTK